MPQTHQTNVADSEAVIAASAAEALESHASQASTSVRVQVTQAGREVTTLDVPASAIPLITAVLRELGAGKAVTVLGDDAEITTQEAAELLNVSRPYLVGLIEKGELAARKIGPRRRLMLADVLTYRAETKAKRREALRELAALDQEYGLR
jgi:excisionase family DNA binding protein